MSKLLSAYLALGLPAGTSLVEALRRYRWLATAYHPDRFGERKKAAAEDEMKRINGAREVLVAHYTQAGHQPKQQCWCVTTPSSARASSADHASAQSGNASGSSAKRDSATASARDSARTRSESASASGAGSAPTNAVVKKDRIVILKSGKVIPFLVAAVLTCGVGNVFGNGQAHHSSGTDRQSLQPVGAANIEVQKVPSGSEIAAEKFRQQTDAVEKQQRQAEFQMKWRSAYEPSETAQAEYFNKLAIDRHERAVGQDRRSIEELTLKLMTDNLSSAERTKLSDLLDFRKRELEKEQEQLAFFVKNPTAR